MLYHILNINIIYQAVSIIFMLNGKINVIISLLVVLMMNRPVIDQNLYYLGMKYTTATLASATANVVPALTFVMALIFRYYIILIISYP